MIMAGMKATILLLLILSAIFLLARGGNGDHPPPLGVEVIYQFGDSLSDTGNYVRDTGAGSSFARLPYGETFFHHPTGRCSDGLIMIDYFAKYFKVPFLDPYLKKDGNFNHGVNFAVTGSTALDVSTLASYNIPSPITNISLSVQLNWFRSHLDSICDNPSDCKSKLRNALFIVGEIGGNDVSYAIPQSKSKEDLHKFVLEVVKVIKHAVKEVIKLGAIRVVVPGNFPIGCMPYFLYRFKTDNSSMYDKLKCLKHLNQVAKFQNDQLQKAIKELQKDHPHVAIVYGDLFSAFRRILYHAHALGFDEDATEKTCCGSGDNPYNYDPRRQCGNGVPVCRDPHARVNWDGIHLTSHAYLHMAKSVLDQIVNGMSHGVAGNWDLKHRVFSTFIFWLKKTFSFTM